MVPSGDKSIPTIQETCTGLRPHKEGFSQQEVQHWSQNKSTLNFYILGNCCPLTCKDLPFLQKWIKNSYFSI